MGISDRVRPRIGRRRGGLIGGGIAVATVGALAAAALAGGRAGVGRG
jgi:hypothetical protein